MITHITWNWWDVFVDGEYETTVHTPGKRRELLHHYRFINPDKKVQVKPSVRVIKKAPVTVGA